MRNYLWFLNVLLHIAGFYKQDLLAETLFTIAKADIKPPGNKISHI
jgi:hypothetical protein